MQDDERQQTRLSGFSLLELLVVILIIGVLAGIAIPYYQHVVLKSRFGTVMPLTKAIAEAQELYFLQNGRYAAASAASTALKIPLPPADSQIKISISGDDQYQFVVGSHQKSSDVHFIMYQQHSPLFPNNIHCEAKKDDSAGIWLCEEELEGVKLEEGSFSGDDYVTYILQGSAEDGKYAQTHYNVSEVDFGRGDKCESTQAGGCSNSSFEGATCTATNGGSCQHSTFVDSECYGNGKGGSADNTNCGFSSYTNSTCYNEGKDGYSCGRSDYTDQSECYSNEKGGCGHASFSGNSVCYGKSTSACTDNDFTNSTCIAEGTGGCKGSTFTNSSCYAKSAGNSSSRSCGSGSTYNNSVCYNQSTQMYGCGSASYDSHSSCYSNGYGGCGGKSTFSGGSECFGNASGACGSNTYSGGSVCHADAPGACNNNTYKDTSYCAGKYCPKDSPRADGTKRTQEGE